MRVVYFCFLYIVFCNSLFAQKLSLTVEAESQSIILGLPLRLVANIHSDQKFTLHGPFGIDCDRHGGILVKDKSGNRVSFARTVPCPQIAPSPFDSEGKIEYAGPVEGGIDIFLPVGSYDIQAYYHSSGPYLDRYSSTDQRPVFGIWEGHVRSNVVSVSVREPDGQDRNALFNLGPGFNGTAKDYAEFIGTHQKEILKEYPGSMYSAVILMRSFSKPENSDPKQMRQIIKTVAHFPSGTGLPDPDSPTGWRDLPPGRPAAEWQIEKATQILRDHPDIPQKERLEVVLGINNLVLGRPKEAKQWLARAASGQKNKSAEWARKFLTELDKE